MMRKPVSQGDLDGFCGLYSIINALTLLFPSSMNSDARDKIFYVIARSLPAIRWPAVLWDGTTAKDVGKMLDAARSAMKHTFQWERPFDKHLKIANFEEFRHELKIRIEGDDAFAIMGISKPWEHWSCAHRVLEHEIKMTDSCHVKQIRLADCGLTGDGKPYEFDAGQTFVLRK
jgi:hypothetical protein